MPHSKLPTLFTIIIVRLGDDHCLDEVDLSMSSSCTGLFILGHESIKSILGKLDTSNRLHTLLTLLLLIKELHLSRHISTIALCGHIFSQGGYSLPCNDLVVDRYLNGHLKELPKRKARRGGMKGRSMSMTAVASRT